MVVCKAIKRHISPRIILRPTGGKIAHIALPLEDYVNPPHALGRDGPTGTHYRARPEPRGRQYGNPKPSERPREHANAMVGS